MTFAAPHALVRLRRKTASSPDPYSEQPTLGPWSEAGEVVLTGCALDPLDSSETAILSGVQSQKRAELLRPGPWVPGLIVSTDRIRDRFGQVWEVEGDFGDYSNPLTVTELGVAIPLRLTRGG